MSKTPKRRPCVHCGEHVPPRYCRSDASKWCVLPTETAVVSVDVARVERVWRLALAAAAKDGCVEEMASAIVESLVSAAEHGVVCVPMLSDWGEDDLRGEK